MEVFQTVCWLVGCGLVVVSSSYGCYVAGVGAVKTCTRIEWLFITAVTGVVLMSAAAILHDGYPWGIGVAMIGIVACFGVGAAQQWLRSLRESRKRMVRDDLSTKDSTLVDG